MSSRTSFVAFVLVKLSVGGEDHFLFIRHAKWGDWGLVGGHVEAGEEGDWLATAKREAEEELMPLVAGIDFSLTEPLLAKEVSWGPVRSRSAHGHPTLYTAQYFALEFLRPPADELRKLNPASFLLVPQSHLEGERWDDDITDTLRRLATALPNGLRDVPHAWRDDLVAADLGVAIRPFGSGAESSNIPLRALAVG